MFILLLLFASLSFGIGIEEAIRTALEKSPQIKALEEEVKVFEGMERSATAFPNPETRLESGFVTNDKDGKPRGRAFYLLEFNQPLPLWGVRGKSRDMVLKEKEAFESAVESRKREILGEVYRSFYRSLTFKELARIWKENYETAKEVEAFVKKAYDLGEVTPLELMRAQREKDLAEVRYKVALARYKASLKELSRLVGVQIDEVEGDLRDSSQTWELDVENLPAVVSVKKRIESIERQIDLERALAKPRVSAGFVVEDADGEYYGLRGALTLEVPVFYRRQGEILQNIALKKALKKRLEGELLRVKSRLESVSIRLETLKEEFERLEKDVIPRAQEELALAIKSYRLRTITLLELSDVRRRYYELLVSRAELLLSMHETYSEFIEIGGWKR
ncbi:TolC family protein [Hydrogenivirga sp. 128-5-R1-1]|uniref:TolC family protein n=1 Tax=Hydrogenivirga sp. 128-5-R1-1 TaxID=392423 RepID=UPI00015F39AA|nr:TolC family protein [Hydrogenivirga sp. 128-5-R1-1]EDP75016.1 DNA-directed RNA polymerase subunit alpha [Hydrogenivirga sp. 128-5-R1-1]